METCEYTAIITDHAFDRGKERLGLNRKALQRTADKCLESGIFRTTYTGGFRRYLDKLFFSHGRVGDLMIYGHHVFVFDGRVLITVLEVPTDYKKTAAKGKAQA